MLFNEIYSNYFKAVAEIVNLAVEGELTAADIERIAMDRAFSDGVLVIPHKVRNNWALIDSKLNTPIENRLPMPLTVIQRRWLKAILADPRIRLFAGDDVIADFTEKLKCVTPVYTPEMIVYFDRYGDGDDYEDEQYISNFRTILDGLHEHKQLEIEYRDSSNLEHSLRCTPYQLEYSEKDDKFRLITSNEGVKYTVNLARIISCSVIDESCSEEPMLPEPSPSYVLLEITDDRNALERVMLHFSHFEKEAKRTRDGRYEIKVKYDRDDEREMLIRVLSFGPRLTAIEPPEFIEQIKERLRRQLELLNEAYL